MKLQMQNDNLRLRIDEAELSALLANTVLELSVGRQTLPFFAMRVVLGDGLALRMDQGWHLTLPRAEIIAYVQTLPNRHALALPLSVDGHALMFQFEVDVRDSLKTRGVRSRH